MPQKISFRLKITLSYILLILFSFSLIALFLYKSLEEQSLREIKTSLLKQAYLTESQIRYEDIQTDNYSALQSLIKGLSKKAQCRITVINASGAVLADSEKSPEETLMMENHADRPEIRSAMGGEPGESIRYSTTLKLNMLYVAVPVRDKARNIAGVVRLSLPLSGIKIALAAIKNRVFISFLFALGLAFLFASLLTRSINNAVNKIISASRRFSAGDFSRKIYLNSADEIGELADTLNKMAQDIEDKIKETEIQNHQLEAVFQSMVEGIVVTDKSGVVISINSAAEQIFNIKREDARGRMFLEAVRNNDISEIISSVLQGGEFISREIAIVWPVQRTFQINASAVVVKQEISGCLVVFHDITEIRRLETMRKDFVANVSHELKTPLTSIKGFVETLLEGALEDQENSRHFLQIIQDHTNRLDRLINDLLDLSYLESDAAKLHTVKVDIRSLTEEMLGAFGSQIKKKEIAVSNEIPAGLAVSADKSKIEQVLTNLIDNAIKFNRQGGALFLRFQDLGTSVKITVEDTGIGIPGKDLPRIFERFYRVDKARSRQLGGTGLGLSIVKHNIELHGGTVGVESTEGLGSKFWFTLPK